MGAVMVLKNDKYTLLSLPSSSFLLVFNQALAVQYSVCLTKTQSKYLKHFITIKLLEKADFSGIVD